MRKQRTENREQKMIRAWRKLYSLFSIHCSQQSERGFTLLLAAIVSSIVLSIGAAIFSIAIKQVTLASIGKNSQLAFYAADTGAECALYWDIRAQAFATSSQSNYLSSFSCDNDAISVTNANSAFVVNATASAATTTFQYEPRISDTEKCVQISVAKSRDNGTGGIVTLIHADGYSTTCTRIGTDSQSLQRSVELHY